MFNQSSNSRARRLRIHFVWIGVIICSFRVHPLWVGWKAAACWKDGVGLVKSQLQWSSVTLTDKHWIWGGIRRVKMFEDVSNQSHDHHGVHGEDVTHPAVQHPVLKQEPAHRDKPQPTRPCSHVHGWCYSNPIQLKYTDTKHSDSCCIK